MNKKIKLSLLAFCFITQSYSQDVFTTTKQDADIEINNKILESNSEAVSNKGSIKVENNSIIKGNLTANNNIEINNSIVESGEHTIASDGTMSENDINIKNSTINGGKFVINGFYYPGSTHNFVINLTDNSVIKNSKFELEHNGLNGYGTINVNNIGTISDSIFTPYYDIKVDNVKLINNSKFNGISTINKVEINNSSFTYDKISNSTINSGEFYGTYGSGSFINNSIINGGNFVSGAKNALRTFSVSIQDTTINNGNFSGDTILEDKIILNNGTFKGELIIKTNDINDGIFSLNRLVFENVTNNNKLNFTSNDIYISGSTLGENITFDTNNNMIGNVSLVNSNISSSFGKKINELSVGNSTINTTINAKDFKTKNINYFLDTPENVFNTTSKISITQGNSINADNVYFNIDRVGDEYFGLGYYGRNKVEFEGNLNAKDIFTSYLTTFKENSSVKVGGDSLIYMSNLNGKLNSDSDIYIMAGTTVGKDAVIEAKGDININKLHFFSYNGFRDNFTNYNNNDIAITGTLISNNITINDNKTKPKNIGVNDDYTKGQHGIIDLEERLPNVQVPKENFIEIAKNQIITLENANLQANSISITDTFIKGENTFRSNETILKSGIEKRTTAYDGDEIILKPNTGDTMTITNANFINNTNQTNEIKIEGNIALKNGTITNSNITSFNGTNNTLILDNVEFKNSNINPAETFDKIAINNMTLNSKNLKANNIEIEKSNIAVDKIDTSNLTVNNSNIYSRVVTDNLTANNSNFYLYGGGENTSLKDKFSGAIIVNQQAKGGNNKIVISNTDLKQLKNLEDGNIPIAIVSDKSISKDYFDVVYYKTAIANYKLGDNILHFDKLDNNDGVWSLGTSDSVFKVDKNQQGNVNISDLDDISAIDKNKNTRPFDFNDVEFVGFHKESINAIKNIMYSPYYAARYYIDDLEHRFTYLRNDINNKGFWVNNDYGYFETDTNNLKGNRILLGIDNKIEFENFNLIYGIKFSKAVLKANKALNSKLDLNSIGIYTGINFNTGIFIDYDLTLLALKSNYKSDIALIDTVRHDNIWQNKIKIGKRFGNNYYLEPNIKLIATHYPSININNQSLDITTNKSTQYTAKTGIKAGTNLNNNIEIKTELSYVKDLNKSPSNSVSDGMFHYFERIQDDGVEINFGAGYKPSANTNIGIELSKSITKHFNNNYNINLGFSYNF